MSEIRVLIVDDHPALRTGLERLLCGEPGITCVGAVAAADGLHRAVAQARPDVVVLGYALGGSGGPAACFAIKQRPDPPAVVLYCASADRAFAVPAAIAQADAAVPKSASAGDLLAVIRRVATGTRLRSRLDAELIEAASAGLLVEDLPVAGMLLGAVPVPEIADLLDLPAAEVRTRALRIIGRLQASRRASPAPSPAPPVLA